MPLLVLILMSLDLLPLKVRMQSLAFRHRRRGIDRGSLEIWARARYGARWLAYHS